MGDDEIAAVRGALEDFVTEVFASLPRKDQRAKGKSVFARADAGRSAEVDAADG